MTPDPENVGPHDRPSISERLRSATAVAHERAEHAPFIDDLMSGRLDSGEYQRLAVQLYFVYEALERVGADLAGDPVADAVLDPKLLRLQRLGADLASFGIDPSTASPLPAVARYVTAIESTRDDPHDMSHTTTPAISATSAVARWWPTACESITGSTTRR